MCKEECGLPRICRTIHGEFSGFCTMSQMSQTKHCRSLHSGKEKTFKSPFLLAKDSEKNDLTGDNLFGNSYPTPAKYQQKKICLYLLRKCWEVVIMSTPLPLLWCQWGLTASRASTFNQRQMAVHTLWPLSPRKCEGGWGQSWTSIPLWPGWCQEDKCSSHSPKPPAIP